MTPKQMAKRLGIRVVPDQGPALMMPHDLPPSPPFDDEHYSGGHDHEDDGPGDAFGIEDESGEDVPPADLPPPPKQGTSKTVDLEVLIRFRVLCTDLEQTERAARAPIIQELLSEKVCRGVGAVRAGGALRAGKEDTDRIAMTHGLGMWAKKIEAEIERFRREIAKEREVSEDTDDLPSVATALGSIADGLGVNEKARIPHGYLLASTGVWKDRAAKADGSAQSPIRICHRPMVVTGLATDADGAGISAELRWWTGRAWVSRWVSKGTLLQRRELAALSSYIPVSSESAPDVVRYLEAYLAVNETVLPTSKTSTRLGWRDEGFLWGKYLITADGPKEDPEIRACMDDPGTAQTLAGYHAKGTMAGWCDMMRIAAVKMPTIYLGVLGAIVPMLYQTLPHAPGFAIEWAGTTRGGKTIVLRHAASAVGEPDDKGTGLIRTWAASLTNVERVAASASFLPLIMDDTRRIPPGREAQLQTIVYMAVQGQGNARGTVTGTQKTATWRTVLLSTGEDRLVDRAQIGRKDVAGGAAARILTFWGSPLGGESEANGDIARAIEEAALQHYGHLGPMVAANLCRPDFQSWVKESYTASVNYWSKRAGNSSVRGSAAKYIALLDVAYQIVKGLGAPECDEDPIAFAWEATAAMEEEAALDIRALGHLWAWTASHESTFDGREESSMGLPPARRVEPHAGWSGKWDKTSLWSEIAFIPHVLEKVLTDAGYVPGSMIRAWQDRGWLVKGEGEHRKKQVRVGGGAVRCWVISRLAFTNAGVQAPETPWQG